MIDPCVKETGPERLTRLTQDLITWGTITCENEPSRLLAVLGCTTGRLIAVMDKNNHYGLLEAYIETLRIAVKLNREANL